MIRAKNRIISNSFAFKKKEFNLLYNHGELYFFAGSKTKEFAFFADEPSKQLKQVNEKCMELQELLNSRDAEVCVKIVQI